MNIEKALEEMRSWIEYEKNNKDKILRADDLIDIQETIIKEVDRQNKIIRQAYSKANNYLYFDDSSDYGVGLWEVIRTLRPDLAEKWDNSDEWEDLKYIEEED